MDAPTTRTHLTPHTHSRHDPNPHTPGRHTAPPHRTFAYSGLNVAYVRFDRGRAARRMADVGERTVYDNRWVRLRLVDVEAPNGERWEYHVVHLDRIAVALIVDDQDRALMSWRYRFVTEQWGYELLGGMVHSPRCSRPQARAWSRLRCFYG